MRRLVLLGLFLVLLAGCGGGSSKPRVSFTAITSLDLPAKDLVYSPATGLLYASVRDTGAQYSNTVVAIDPVSGLVVDSASVGSNPTVLALSSDNRYLYVAVDNAVTRLDVAALEVGPSFSLGDEPWGRGPMDAKDIEVLPDRQESVVVSLKNEGYSPGTYGVAVFDNGVRRPTMTTPKDGVSLVVFDPSDPSRLLGADMDSTEFGLYKLHVTEEGISVEEHTSDVFTSFADDVKIAGGLVYSSAGDVVDPVSKKHVGCVADIACGVEPDPTKGLIYTLVWNNWSLDEMFLQVIDAGTFRPVGSVSVEKIIQGIPNALVRWGEDGIAFSDGNSVHLLRIVVAS